MKISTKAWLATVVAIGTLGLIAAMIGWANAEVADAARQRGQATEMNLALNDLRLVTFEYILHRHPRARQQEQAVHARLERLMAAKPFVEPQQIELLEGLRRRSALTHSLIGELQARRADSPADSPAAMPAATSDEALMRRFELHLTSRLLIDQQESVADVMRLSHFATERINAAQQRVVLVIGFGLSLIAAIVITAAVLVHRNVLAPIAKLEQATRELAAGNWSYQLDILGKDEIGQLSRHFNTMTQTLRDAFARIEHSNLELAALNKEIEAFSYSVSHDLRGPLRSMDGFSLALLEDYGDLLDAQGQDFLQRIRAASQRMARLIDELLGLSRVTRAELVVRAVNLSEIARGIADTLEQQGSGRAVSWVIDEGMTVQADKALMQIAMQNLLENAWKFTAKTEAPLIRVGSQELEGQTVCFVSDNGVGFDMAYADRLFGAFQRLHHESEFSGTGIGLAIVQRIVRRHGGRIWAQATPDQGATFFFSLTEQINERNEQGHLAG
jgi:signal transduction histidine kinase